MKGILLDAKPDMFHALNTNETGWTLTIQTRFLKRKINTFCYDLVMLWTESGQRFLNHPPGAHPGEGEICCEEMEHFSAKITPTKVELFLFGAQDKR